MQRDDPNPIPTFPSGAFRIVHAEVHAGTARTSYLRMGSGPPLLALAGPGDRDRWADIVGPLSAHFKVIAPEPVEPTGSTESERGPLPVWMSAFLDGLGIASASVIASEQVGVAALWFALRDPDRVERLVLVHREGADPLDGDPALADRLSRSGLPLLMVGLPDASAGPGALAAALEPVIAFLTATPLGAA
jgi:pimeloyl-ACP methyl ester carboxylesterase